MTKKQNEEVSGVNLVSAILRLLDKNVPVLAFWVHKGELKKLGTQLMSDWFDELDDVEKHNLKSSMVQDMINLSNNRDPLLNEDDVPVKVRASSIYKSLTDPVHPSGTPLLPFPLTLMSKKEMAKYISDMIRSDAKDHQKTVVYGSENYRPSFWLEEDWSWSNMKTSVHRTKENMFTGQGSWVEFLSKTIRVLLESKCLNPETHVLNLEEKVNTLQKKKRFRGIHEPPAIITGDRTEGNRSIDDGGNQHQLCQDDSVVENTQLYRRTFPPSSTAYLSASTQTGTATLQPSTITQT